ncbi:MAG: CPBP family intramembrane metalloprotease domain-containing protein [Acidobacteria bacterium]|nr:MAG: CPBP family intramembrane metalloprotease domain-containing protein [Acidobacteriota bacterium]PYY23780.1 MAG: CPBP family intramembrane metalloprotease domain-containing protein [Acidobacteriota bacterium]
MLSGLAARVQGHLLSAYISFALLVMPIWFFGFGIADRLRVLLSSAFSRVSLAAFFAMPYAVFALPAREFRWRIQLGFLLICLAGAALLEWARRQHGTARGGWQDVIVLVTLGLSVDLRVFESAWPYAGISGLSKLVLVDLALYGYLVIRQLEGIGYDLRANLSDVVIGVREFVFLAPIAIALGLSLHFLHWHWTMPRLWLPVAAWAFTFLFIAIPEELFFRGLVQNLLERSCGRHASLVIASILFGLSHFNKRLGTASGAFNWRYVLLAAVAGIFYGRAWMARRRLMASAITHTSIDVTWGIWLR